MKKILGILAIALLYYPLQAQEAGNATISASGNFDGINAIMNSAPAVNSTYTVTGTDGTACAGSASLLSLGGSGTYNYSWSPGAQTAFQGQTRQYYNPNTGRYESAPPGGNSQANAPLPYDNTVIFDADVLINIKASSYTAIFSTTDFGTTAQSADSVLGARLKTFIDGLKRDSIRDEDIHIDFITMLPVYEVQPENRVFSNIATERPAGFKIKKNVHVLFYDHRKLDHIITDAAHAGIYDLVKVDYNVNNIESAYDTLRKIAVGVIDMKRKTYDNMGFITTILTMAEGYDSKYPEERYASYTAFVQGVSAQNVQQQNPNVQIREADKEQTIFYNKVSYKQFDRVLNADLAEPGVQFYYKLRVKCKMEQKPSPLDPKGTAPKAAVSAASSGANVAGSYHPQTHVSGVAH